ncbi:DUF222 domain-containing protein [Pseudonocardia sp. C8]|uniref:HNH endonuclease signature motif containing protein n=1 Tax=Pseudonocardia sp. C8 TaxID=2762759 RepID=UPI001642460F|nr:HNH endonuclease signature motif containing protein [Pseudonocardia sp. C8]MBC3191123.1 DUF222 domain-containing protein [Pseudonocardia sp. C8]
MPSDRLAAAHRLLTEAIAALDEVAGPAASDDELLSVLTLCEGAVRRLDRVTVSSIATLERRGTFTERGYRTPAAGLADLLNWERSEARRRTRAAEQVHPRTGLDGGVQPPRLPATAQRFAEGRIGLRHVDVIASVLDSHAARRVSPERLAAAEEKIAEHACVYNPSELHTWARRLIEALDEDGAEPDDAPPPQRNTLKVVAHRSGSGGRISGRFDDAARFDAIAAAVDALAAPRDHLDDRRPEERQADALSELCAQVLERGELPETGGRRPMLNVLIGLEDLQRRAQGALLDFGGQVSPESLRMLACDAAVVPIVMNGAGQPLDVGRATRTIPDGLRRAVTARDRGCAHPGCDRPPSWCEVHHIVPWEHGGDTALSNTVMVCKVHHRLLHHPGWVVRIRDGLPEFVPPRWIDPLQQPRRQPRPATAA